MNLSFIPPMDDIPEYSMNTTETHYTPLEDFKIINYHHHSFTILLYIATLSFKSEFKYNQ